MDILWPMATGPCCASAAGHGRRGSVPRDTMATNDFIEMVVAGTLQPRRNMTTHVALRCGLAVMALGTFVGCGGPDPVPSPPQPDPEPTGDVCKPYTELVPEIVVGHGFGDYLVANDYDIAEVEAGPQGGFHIWIGARIKNIARSGSITTLAGSIPDAAVTLDESRLVFTLDRGDGGWCELHGLRLIIADSQDGILPLLGQRIMVTVTLLDPDGVEGFGERWLTLSDEVIGL